MATNDPQIEDRSEMENIRIQRMIDERMKLSLAEHKTSMLTDMEKMLEKISGNSNFEQMNKISSMLTGTQTFKRKSNEEQFKYNNKVSIALDEADHLIQSNKLQESRQKIAEAKDMIAHRQKLIRLADSSELGWRVVSEYESNPLASDSDDERKMYKAETRANKKLKAEKAKKSRSSRSWPYRKPTTAPASTVQGSVATQQAPRRPGLCFACGKPGHWKGSAECSANSSNNKISSLMYNNVQNEILSRIQDPEIPISQRGKESHESDVIIEQRSPAEMSPVGRLKQNIPKWKEVPCSTFILDVIENGYKLPFKSVPESIVLKNNKTARDNSRFVEQEIQNLVLKGIVSETDNIPHVVNPLTVAYNRNGKPRLVLDCRHINPCLHQFKVKFEDIKVAETLFNKNSFLFTFDLKGAYMYHHVDIFVEHRTYLGFSYLDSGHTKYYVFNSLPFGIKTADHIFTKLLRVVVTFLRSYGHKIIMFLDDGIGGHSNYEKALHSSEVTMQTLISFGFLLANEKCNWVPIHRLVWLGHVLDMEQNMIFISDERIQRLENTLDSVIYQVSRNRENIIPVKVLAGVAGQIISLQYVIGNKVRLMTRELFNCINARASWNAPVKVTGLALNELKFWKVNVSMLNKKGKKLKDNHICVYRMFVDASAFGYGGYVENNVHVGYSDIYEKEMTESKKLPEVSCTNCANFSQEKDTVLSKLSPEVDLLTTKVSLEVDNLISTMSPEVGIENSSLSPGDDCSASRLSPEVDNMLCGMFQEEDIIVCRSPEADNLVRKMLLSVKDMSPEVDNTGVGLKDTITHKLDEAGIHGELKRSVTDNMASYLLQSRADTTVKKYQNSFDQFKSYCDKNGLVSKPALPIIVAMYFTNLLDMGKSDNVVSAAYYGIKWVHSINDLPDPTENSIVKQLLETAKRISSKPVQKKDVVSSEILQTLCSKYQDSVDIIDLRDLSMIMLAYAGFMRMNEVSNLRCNDVQFNSNHVVLKIRQSKTDIYRDGSEIVIAKGSSSACPYTMLQRYMSAANLTINSDDFLFKPAFRSKHVASLIGKNKKLSYTRAKECIVDKLKSVAPGLKLGTHFLRASGATSVANTAGVSDRCLKRHGRWKTDVAKDGYVKDSLEKRLTVTKLLNL